MKLHFSPNWIVAASARLQIEQYYTTVLIDTYTICWRSPGALKESFRITQFIVLKVSRKSFTIQQPFSIYNYAKQAQQSDGDKIFF